MPVYKWTGVDHHGVLYQGIRFAPDGEDLRTLLKKHDIGLVAARKIFFQRPLAPSDLDNFYIHFSSLLKASLTVTHGLKIIRAYCRHQLLASSLDHAILLLEQGMQLHKALQVCGIADELCLALVSVGEKSGDLAKSLQIYVEHRAIVGDLKKKVRSALIGPFITFIFFIIVVVAVFVWVIPLFEHYFSSYNEPLPALTCGILEISRLIRSVYSLYFGVGGGVVGAVVWLVLKRKCGSIIKKSILKIPFIGNTVLQAYRVRLLTMLTVLVRQGVPLVEAFELAGRSFKNGVVSEDVQLLTRSIAHGEMLSAVWKQSLLGDEEVGALFSVGEAGGELAKMIDYAASRERALFYESIGRYVSLVQPLIVCCMGLLIAALIFAVYMPILTLSTFVI